MKKLKTWIRSLAFLLLLALVPFGPALAEELMDARGVFEEEWSQRLLQEQARVDRARKRLDEANAGYARAVAKGADDLVVASFESRRKAAAAELEAAEKKLPQLVEEARDEGIPEEILKPYRFAVSPAGI